jgi:hypothetical protein
MTQTTPQRLDAVRLGKTLTAAQKKLDLSEKLPARRPRGIAPSIFHGLPE